MSRRLLVALSLLLIPSRLFADPFTESVRPLVEATCLECHTRDLARGGIALDAGKDAASVRADAFVWRKVIDQVRDGTMPPANRKRFTAEQTRALITGLSAVLDQPDARPLAQRDPGPALLRRLTRAQYNRTVRDLLALNQDISDAVGIPEEPAPTGYATLAAGLTLPPALLEKYLSAADQALEIVFTPLKPGGSVPQGTRHPGFHLLASVVPADGISERVAVKRSLEAFLPRAFRGPIESAEIDRYLALYDRVRAKGESHEVGLRWVARAALVSPRFLFRIERDRPDAKGAYPLSDHELATRLAYFLQGTMPDAELLRRADQGRLSEPATLADQAKRLLADPGGRALTEDFLARWVGLEKLDNARPSSEFFPTLTPRLRLAMHDEVFLFLDGLRTADRSILDVLSADYTYLNADLARHYGIPGVSGPEMRRVSLKPEWHRGGLVTMAAPLTATSHTFRTSPTLRGKWILDVLLGTPPPPPPPDAGLIDDSKARGSSPESFRELLAQHASQPACANCHRRIDPLGFGLENFDAIGRWRDGRKPNTIDASGTLPGGDTFVGPDEMRRVLARRQPRIVRNLVEQTLTFALGRELKASDDPVIVAILARLEKNGYRFSELVLGVVESQPFRYRINPMRANP